MTVMAKKMSSVKVEQGLNDEQSIAEAIRDEFMREDGPRMDALARLTGRFNRRRGRRVMMEVLAAAKRKGEKDVNALLDRHV